jgi:hypothetical protein
MRQRARLRSRRRRGVFRGTVDPSTSRSNGRKCSSSLVDEIVQQFARTFKCAASQRIVEGNASRTQALTAGRTLVRVGRTTASGSSSRSSVSSRPTFPKMATRAALLNIANATTVAAPMPSQNHTGTTILSAFTAAPKPTAPHSRTLLM